MSNQQQKPALNEQTFEKLLEAAYVLQEHNRKMRILEESLESQSEQLREQELANQARLQRPRAEPEARSNGDYTLTLAEIVEAQHQIQMRHLELDQAMAVVAERIARITGASGAGIGLLEGATVRYRAAAGPPALPVGTEVPLQTAVCQANVRTGQVIRTQDVNTEFLYDPEPCRQRGILSLVAVPIHYDGNIVGALELYFDRLQGFAEQDIHTCQLMAGLVTEAIGRDTELKIKKTMVAERTTMLEAIERLQPRLTAAAKEHPPGNEEPLTDVNRAGAVRSPCWKCGNSLVVEEQFCGKCGAPRVGETDLSSMQSKLASALQRTGTGGMAGLGIKSGITVRHGQPDTESRSDEVKEITEGENHDETALSVSLRAADEPNSLESDGVAAGREPEEIILTAESQDVLEYGPMPSGALARFWRSRRGDFYLVMAIILVAVVVRWGVWSESPAAANGRATSGSAGPARSRRPAPDADLSLFDKFLIGAGLAEAPEAPEYKGNPNTQVWIDLQNALYYCPDSDLYGKTPKGRMATQHDAQLDQFEPANRKGCN